MNRYRVEASGHYSCGMAVIAAASKEEALIEAANIKGCIYFGVKWKSCDSAQQLPEVVQDGAPRIVTFFEHGE